MAKRHDSGKRHLRKLLELKFSGGNLDFGSLPASNAIEVTTFERLIIAFAKRRYRRNNPSRKKVPKNFDTHFRLTLAKIKDGSTLVPLRPLKSSEQQTLVDGFELTAATEDLFEALNSILRGEIVPDLDAEAVSQLRRLGTSLRDDETLTLGHRTSQPIRYGMEERKRVAESLTRGGENLTSILIGRVKMLDISGKFEINLINGNPVEGNVSEVATWNELHTLLTRQAHPPLLWLACTWMHTGHPDEVVRIIDVQEAGSLPDLEQSRIERLAQLAALPDGWLDGEGVHLAGDTLQRAAEALASIDRSVTPEPAIFLGDEGEVRLEWLAPEHHSVLTVDPDGHYAIFITATDGSRSTYEEGITTFKDASSRLGHVGDIDLG